MEAPTSPPLPRPTVRRLSPVAHGALDFAELEQHHLDAEAVLDFSTNTNPYGPSPQVAAALQRVIIERYPDREALALRRTLAGQLGVSPDHILAGNGSAELLWLIALAYIDPGQRVLIAGPTFGEYARAAGMMGAQVEELRAAESAHFAIDTAAVTARLAQSAVRLVFVCNPNNPTGQALPAGCLADWAAAFPRTLFVVDEAYLAFAGGLASAIDLQLPNLLILRSLTKDYALTGLRLGYAAGHPAVIAALRQVRPPWNVNAMALEAGVAALADPQPVLTAVQRLRQARVDLTQALQTRGFAVVPTQVHYFLVRVGDGAAFRAALRPQGILVRDCASFGLPAYVRIAARRPEENARLLQAIDAVRP